MQREKVKRPLLMITTQVLRWDIVHQVERTTHGSPGGWIICFSCDLIPIKS